MRFLASALNFRLPKAKGRDKYLRDSFCLYLEELGMAHREAVRPADLDRLYELFDTIAGDHPWRSVSPKNAFDVAESCLHLLREVARDAREEIPSLASWSRSGPFYSKNLEEDGYYHHLGFFFHRKQYKEIIGAGLTFHQDGDWARWQVWRIQKNQGFDKDRVAKFERICGRNGALDREKMLRSFVKSAKALGIRG